MYKAKKKQRVDDWRIYRLHSECVRRNLNYLQDYQEWKERSGEDFSTDIYRWMVAGKWGLLQTEALPNPAEWPSLDAINTEQPPKAVRLPREETVDPFAEKGLSDLGCFPIDLKRFPASIGGLLVLTYFHENALDKWSRHVINIRLSKKEIMHSLEELVDHWLQHRKESGLSQQKPDSRIKLKPYIEYLKIYDHKKSGKTFRQIGEMLWAKDSEIDVELKARTYHARAKRLILNPPLLGKPSTSKS